MIAVIIAASLLIGVSLGILGGGGSILTVPILVYLAGMETKEAIATSLFVVGTTSAAAVVSHARAGRVRWRTGLLFGLAGMTGAYAGGRLAEFIPGTVLLLAFALMMIATAVAMIRGRRGAPKKVHHELPILHVLLDGIVVGLVTGLVGAGGGFLVVPALVLLGGLPMTVAVGTSLLVISMKSFAGLAGYLASVHIDWGFAALVTATAVVGSILGGLLAGRIPQDALRKSFGWFVAVMGVFVLSQQTSSDLRRTLLTSPWTWASVAAAAGVAFSWYMLRNVEGTRSPTNDVSAPSIEEDAQTAPHPTGEDTVRSGGGTVPSPHDTQQRLPNL
ncbi:sulfite exporter TauE/SafE family protein [Streptomyces sp. Agncl-13]|uniref:sulfite exporter TauE/SafE family protein n=1 Tax=Streptomyces sp. Agncl-13 TaxID=3400628 RepID=UPI003A867421